jgi:diaminohydroxyphosphoribosylaminopyrimidine deaminase/5-amino-6-(5-phosphoribosylamino)uracil reductase
MSAGAAQHRIDMRLMSRAARIALRGHGGAEPNPMVGCVIASSAGEVISEGYHRRCGGAHAEVHALAAAGERARGATAYVTLEPCAHHGRTPPCASALISAGVARVVFARPDPNAAAQGGAEALRRAGIEAVHLPHAEAAALTDGFARRVLHGMPRVIAKWAATRDGRCAADADHGRWISSARSRALVHRERARVDAILTTAATVIADDPHLMPRVARMRRVPRRIVIDRTLRIPAGARIIRTAAEGPVEIACDPRARGARTPLDLDAFARAGIRWHDLPPGAPIGDTLRALLKALAADGVSTVLTEAGPALVSALLAADLVDDAWVFTAPAVPGDDASALWPHPDPALFECAFERERGGDMVRLWRRTR